ncbi:hypothetical protein CCZ01_05960 [Helicobacter monodelphidis]|uniref:ABC transporter ATP-binding protein n=1 Tax=Helicobacter sp. 15-1451 TaxID=2004995 RepID=UPI000DCB51BE|nr:ABC transporter ATP-binding protein [Helicobacter sp. 15-1451]RAX57525.1 hypothetical protein CCZ01_05960 [Helicobacter sp. 15-1451]
MIKIYNLSKQFKNIKVLHNLNLEIQKGEFIVLLGASGCGKTTLLDILGGFLEFDAGEVCINGQVYTHQVDITQCVKVFQDYALIPWKNVLDNVSFSLLIKGFSKKEARKKALEYIKLTHLNGFEHRFIKELSGGQRQRVALARALSIQPQILLLDEPFSALDNFTKLTLQNELLEICKNSNSTFIFVTHDIEEAIFLGTKVIIMAPSKIVAQLDTRIDKSDRLSLEFLKLKKEIAKYLEIHRFNNPIEYVI